jgi:hypothetical protein
VSDGVSDFGRTVMNQLNAWMLAAILFSAAVVSGRAQVPLGGTATDFNTVEYFEVPHQQQVKTRLSGAQAQPLSGGLLLIKQLKLEMFDEDGKTQFIARAPECIYDPVHGQASSPGEVHLRTGNGELTIDGEGFLWQQNISFFIISNQVQTLIQKMPVIQP